MKLFASCLLLAAPYVAAGTQAPPSCESPAHCALLSARDASFRHFAAARDADGRKLALQVLEWSVRQEQALDTTGLRERFTALRAQVDKLPANERAASMVLLAEALAAADFNAEAQAMGAALATEPERDAVRGAVARSQARHGRMREAFAALDSMQDKRERLLAFSGVLNAIAATGKPELAGEAAKYMKDPPADPRLTAGIEVLAKQAAGRHDEARAQALALADTPSRITSLYQLVGRYQKQENHAEAVKTARLLREETAKLDNQRANQEVTGMLVDSLLELNAHAEALPLVSQLSERKRTQALRSILRDEKDMRIINQAAREVAKLPEDERGELQDALLLARVRLGDLKPAAAFSQASDRGEFAEGLIETVQWFPPARLKEAQEALQAVIGANEDAGDRFWNDVASAQGKLGLFAEARKTIDSRIEEPNMRGLTLIRVSASQQAQGRTQDAQRSRAEGMKMIEATGGADKPGTFGMLLANAGLRAEAEAELRARMRAATPRLEYRDGPSSLILYLVNDGEQQRAVEFAAATSKYLQDSPEPFVDAYTQILRIEGPELDSPMLKSLRGLE